MKKAKDYAFVHFAMREDAEEALEKSGQLMIDGSAIEVSWSKPVDKTAYNTRKQLTKILSTGTVPAGQAGLVGGGRFRHDSPHSQLHAANPQFVPFCFGPPPTNG